MRPTLILASASPRRSELLRQVGLEFDVAVSRVEEVSRPGESPADFCTRMALEKAMDVARTAPTAVALGADTVVVLDGQILGKPRSDQDACRMLRLLSGRTHQVVTGVALAQASTGRHESFHVSSDVEFRELGRSEIERYVATREPMDKAGAYAIQGMAAAFVKRIAGSFSNIVGLPLFETVEALRAFGISVF